MTLADPPPAKSALAPEMEWWTPAGLAAFLTAVEGDDLYPLFRLAALTGLRRGEVCGLRWAEVDLDKGLVQVRPPADGGERPPGHGGAPEV